MQKVCFVCLQPSRLKCSRCDAIQYCGKECQKKDWKVHKLNCQDKNSVNNELNKNEILFNQAQNYLKQGNHHRAEKSFRKLLEPSLRSKHTYHFLAECFINLSIVLHNQGKYSEAVEIAQESLNMCRSKLGANHHFTLQSMDSLATSYTILRQFNEAYELLNECIERSTIMNGNDDQTIRHMTTLGDAYREDGRHDEAQKILRECLAMITNNDDEQYLGIISRLAASCIKTSQYEEAENLYKDCLEKVKLMKGENHPDTIATMMNLANVYVPQNKFVEAEGIRKECLAKSIVIRGKDHISTLSCMINLAVSYSIQSKFDEAKKMLKNRLERMKIIQGENHPDTLDVMNNLGINYENWSTR